MRRFLEVVAPTVSLFGIESSFAGPQSRDFKRYMASLNGQRVILGLPLPDVAAPVEPEASLMEAGRWWMNAAGGRVVD